MDYEYYNDYGDYGGGPDFSLAMIVSGLLPIILLVAAIAIAPRILRKLRSGASGADGEPLMPSGDPMRYALASAVLKGSMFRRRIIDRAQNPFLAHAPEAGLDYPLLVSACRRMEDADKRWQWTFFALLVIPFVLPWLFLEVFRLYDLYQLIGLITLLSWLGLFALAVYRRWMARFRDVRPFRAEEYDFETVWKRFGDGKFQGYDETRSNVIAYGQTNPFTGMGFLINNWQVGVDLKRAQNAGETPHPVTTDQIYDAVLTAVRGLNIPGLDISEVAFVNGTETSRIPEIQSDRFSAPASETTAAVMHAWRSDPNAVPRVYAWLRVFTSGGELRQSYFFRCVRRGEVLLLEAVQTVLPPVAKTYREVDGIRRLGFFGMIGWAATAILLSPVTVFSALIGVAGQVQEFISNVFGGPVARERKEIRLNPMYNYGARETVREMMMADKYHIYFQRADGAQMNKAIDIQVLNATADVLKDAGVDVSVLVDQVTTIMQSNVSINTQGGAVAISGNANVGGVGGAMAKAVGAMTKSRR